MWDDLQPPSHPATHLAFRKDDAAPFAYSTPAQLEAAAGPEPMRPLHIDWVTGLAWAAVATAVAAAIGLLLGLFSPQISATLGVLGRFFPG
jgi:uncharacterized membrane protein YphA (DoxX/SURF4 family)